MTKAILAGALALALSASAASAVTFRVAVETGDAVPGIGDAFFAGLGNPRINNNGDIAFSGFFTGAGVVRSNDSGIFTSSSLVAREGDPAPGTVDATFTRFGDPKLNDGGEVVFQGDLAGSGATFSNRSGIFTSSGMVVRTGDAAPGIDGATFDSISNPLINAGGEIAFNVGLIGDDINVLNNEAV